RIMKPRSVLDPLPRDLRAEVFEDIVRSESVRIERIVSKGHSSPVDGGYDQDEHEWVMVVRGRACLRFEDGATCELSAGDCVTIPAHSRRRAAWTDPGITIWLAVFYRSSVETGSTPRTHGWQPEATDGKQRWSRPHRGPCVPGLREW